MKRKEEERKEDEKLGIFVLKKCANFRAKTSLPRANTKQTQMVTCKSM
jgi:hypothetical protein